jgi:hypothetical protein
VDRRSEQNPADRADVKNAADKQQVTRAAAKERRKYAQARAAVVAVLSTVDGRAFCWSLLESARVFESIWHPSAQIHYNAGRQDFGHQLMADLIAADERLYQLMESEARARLRREQADTDAAHTPSASTGARTDET